MSWSDIPRVTPKRNGLTHEFDAFRSMTFFKTILCMKYEPFHMYFFNSQNKGGLQPLWQHRIANNTLVAFDNRD